VIDAKITYITLQGCSFRNQMKFSYCRWKSWQDYTENTHSYRRYIYL